MATKSPKTTEVATVDGKSADVGAFASRAEMASLAASIGLIDLSGSIDERANLAAEHMNRSQRHMLASGLLLASVKAECDHGEFAAMVEARGFEMRAAQKAMQYAEFIARQPAEQRLRLIELPRSRVMEIAGADPEVIEDLLSAEGENSIDALSVRALRDRIRELEASSTDLAVQRGTAEAEAERLRKQMKRVPNRADGVPLVVADLRAEIMALGKKADLALDSFQGLGVEIVQLMGTDSAHGWAHATLRLALSQLLAARLQLDGLIAKYLKELPDGDPTPIPASYLTKDEVLEAARMFQQLTQTHTYEAALREWEREQARPRDKGRPKAKPVPPKGGEA